jgi:hypothetical protein
MEVGLVVESDVELDVESAVESESVNLNVVFSPFCSSCPSNITESDVDLFSLIDAGFSRGTSSSFMVGTLSLAKTSIDENPVIVIIVTKKLQKNLNKKFFIVIKFVKKVINHLVNYAIGLNW